ncbi:hypothetical protein GGR50DRAFT_610409 [Xylaria sp. CBS 124048]|nr:hypothetical protein GGR50DRAFT_610409 [Xylaria sp. CBS 124048]
MKPTTIFHLLALSSCALAAPLPLVLHKIPNRDAVSNSAPRQGSSPSPGLPPGATIQVPREQNAIKTPEQIHISKGLPIPPPSSPKDLPLLPPTPKKTPRRFRYHYLASLTSTLSDDDNNDDDDDDKIPFTRSSIVRAETRANTVYYWGEPEEGDPETNGWQEEESYDYIRIFQFPDDASDYRPVEIHVDTIVVGLVLSFIAVVLVVELWKPVSARIYRLRCNHGPIYLDDTDIEETTGQEDLLSEKGESS